MEFVALALVVIVGAGLTVGALVPRPAVTGQPVATSRPAILAALPRPAATAAPTPGLSARAYALPSCGSLAGTGSYDEGGLVAARRVSSVVSLSSDEWWTWCVTGVRAYADGVEVLGRLMLLPDDGPGRPHAVFRAAEFAFAVPGFGELGPATMSPTSEGRVVLRYDLPGEPGARTELLRTFAAATSFTLRIVAIDDGSGSYVYRGPAPDPRLSSDHTAEQGQYGLGAAPRASQPVVTLPLSTQ